MVNSKILLVYALLSVVCFASCSTSRNKDFSNVKYIRNHDGDTITVNINNVHPIIGKEISVRVYGIDTPEIRTKNMCEKKKAVEAKLLVKELLVNADNIEIRDIKRDKYFRIVGKVYADGVSVGEMLLKKKLAYPYYGKTKSNIDWCF